MSVLFSRAPNAASVGGVGTVAKIFPAQNQAALGGPQATVAAILPVFGGGRYEGFQLEFAASGRITVGATAAPTINFVLQSGTSLVAANNTTIATLGAAQAVVISTSFPWYLWGILQGDSTSGRVQGQFQFGLGLPAGSVLSAVAATTPMTGINFNPSSGNLILPTTGAVAYNLVMGIVFGVSDAANLAVMNQFEIDV